MCVTLRVMRPRTCACLRMRALLRLPHLRPRYAHLRCAPMPALRALRLRLRVCATPATPRRYPGVRAQARMMIAFPPLAYMRAQARMRKICIFRAVPKNALDAIFACFFAPSANVFLCPAAYHARIMRTR